MTSADHAALSDADRAHFDEKGYLVVENALSASLLKDLNHAVDRIYAEHEASGDLEAGGKLNLRNCIVHDDIFLKLVDWPSTAPLAWQILGWNIQILTTHLIVLPSSEGECGTPLAVGLHRDGGTSSREMTEPHPRIMLKIAYALSDQTDPASGATVLVPGSNRMTGRPPVDESTGETIGARAMGVSAGSAFLFEQRTWHGIGRNHAGFPRKTIFVGYGYRWVKPMDYVEMPGSLLARCNPVQRQLLGSVSDPLSYYIPRDEDVPLKRLLES